MIDEKLARLRTHRNNIARYRCLLKTKLTNLERQFIERRLSEEQSDFERLAAGTFPRHVYAPAASRTSYIPRHNSRGIRRLAIGHSTVHRA